METRASYIVVGAFTLLVLIGALLFVLWTAKNREGDLRTCEIVFNQSVSGLSVGGAVTLQGVRIGQVTAIKVSPTDPRRVIVRVRIANDAPIREDSVAVLEPQGITGLSGIAVSGGAPESPLLSTDEDGIARIPSRPSRIQEIMNNVPSILSNLDAMVGRANEFFSEDNARIAESFMKSLAEITETIAQNRESIGKTMLALGEASDSFAVAGKRLEKLIANGDSLVNNDLRKAVQSIDKTVQRVDNIIVTAEPGLTKFSRESTEELNRLLVDARRLAVTLAKVSQQLESDPRRFLLGNSVPEFSIP